MQSFGGGLPPDSRPTGTPNGVIGLGVSPWLNLKKSTDTLQGTQQGFEHARNPELLPFKKFHGTHLIFPKLGQ